MTAFNQLQPRTYDIAGDMTVDDLGAWLVNYCNENTNQNVVNAASTLMGALRDQRLTMRPGGSAQDADYDPQLVRDVQVALKEEGYYTSAVDGLFGPGTKEAIIAFQQDRELPVTGLPPFSAAERRRQACGYDGQGWRLAHIPTGSTAARYDKRGSGGMIRHRNTP